MLGVLEIGSRFCDFVGKRIGCNCFVGVCCLSCSCFCYNLVCFRNCCCGCFDLGCIVCYWVAGSVVLSVG